MRLIYFSVLMLAFAATASARDYVCVPEKEENPIYLIHQVDSKMPVLTVKFQNGVELNDLPCVSTSPGSDFECEQFADYSAHNRYFSFIENGAKTQSFLVKIIGFSLRDQDGSLVKHKIVGGDTLTYFCR